MSQSGAGARERGGSFAAPNERPTNNNASNDNEIKASSIPNGSEEEALEDVTKRDHIKDQQVTDRSFCSPPSRQRLGASQRMGTVSGSVVGILDATLHRPSRSTTASPRGSHPEPPVTKATLAELDVPRIVLNPKLRHDVNFDPDLHFRPNLDGEKGKRKLQKANEFWDVLKVQLQDFMEDPVAFEAEHAGKEWCLPATLRAIGDILETLVPPEDRSAVAAIMNVDMLMQQLKKGVADLESLAGWLAKTLKLHCAPMRDEWVNEMVVQLSTGNQNRDVGQLAAGLQTLMGVLEAMKLDVANHQIRCLRPLLIQDTIDFEQTFFMKKIAARKVDVTYAHSWMRTAHSATSGMPPNETMQPDLWSFFRGFANCLLPSHSTQRVPDTFMFDEERIVKLRADMLDAINTEICMRLFRKVYAEAHAQAEAQRQKQLEKRLSRCSNSSRSSTPTEDDERTTPSPTIPGLPDFHSRIQASAMATERGTFRKSEFPDTLVWEPYGSPSPSLSSLSPTSSRSTTPLSFQDQQPAPTARNQSSSLLQSSRPTEAQEATLLSQLTALLTDITPPLSTPANSVHLVRWTLAAPHLALGILHATSHPVASYTSILPNLERILSSAFSTPSSLLFSQSESSVLGAISPIASHLINTLVPLNNSRIFEISVLPRGKAMLEKLLKEGLDLCSDEQKAVGSRAEVLEIVRGMAHVGVLHWRVWGPLCYKVDPDAVRSVSEAPEVEMAGMESSVTSPIGTSPRDREAEKDRIKERRRRSLRRRSAGR